MDTEAGTAPKSYAEIQTLIFDPLCVQCHRGGAAPRGLSLEANRSYRGLVLVPSSELPSLLRVAPGQPDSSYLVVKIRPSDPRRVGARMPRNGPPYVSAAQIRAVERWIAAGAAEDWVDDGSEVPVVPTDGGAPEGGSGGAGGAGGEAGGGEGGTGGGSQTSGLFAPRAGDTRRA